MGSLKQHRDYEKPTGGGEEKKIQTLLPRKRKRDVTYREARPLGSIGHENIHLIWKKKKVTRRLKKIDENRTKRGGTGSRAERPSCPLLKHGKRGGGELYNLRYR